jgi:hypothetical protein
MDTFMHRLRRGSGYFCLLRSKKPSRLSLSKPSYGFDNFYLKNLKSVTHGSSKKGWDDFMQQKQYRY